jgi:uncharacterized membrane protein
LILLAASLALNLFFLGLMAGRQLPLRTRPSPDEVDARFFLRHSGLRDAGPEVKELMRQRRGEMRERMRAIGDARERVRQALQAEPFDRPQTEQALRQTRELTSQMQADMHQTLADVAGKLDHEQRKRMADSLWGRKLPR